MAEAAAIIAAASIAAAGSVGAAALSKPKSPKMPDPPKNNDSRNNQAAMDAADRQRKQAASAMGRSDTILTGPQGLGSEPQTQRKTLLGG